MDTDAGSTRAKPDGAAGGVRKRPYDLEDRTLAFARRCRAFVRRLPRTVANAEDAKQLVRASGSVGANYIEANEALSKKDFRMRVKISRKEAKEARYWTRLVDLRQDASLADDRDWIVRKATELMNIFGAMLRNTK